jgi:hypothetical protein
MPIVVHSEPAKEVNWAVFNEYVMTKTKKITPSTIRFIEESKPFGVNWALCMLWCAIRTEWWTHPCWYKSNDVGNMGGKYMTSRESTRVACEEFDKFVDTAMIVEQQAIERAYNEMESFCKNWNPDAKDPVIEPPKPMPLPPLPEPEPLPKPTPAPGKGFNWKVLVPLAVGLLTLLTGLLPPPWNFLVKLIVSALGGMID